jgi:hypothetical protein
LKDDPLRSRYATTLVAPPVPSVWVTTRPTSDGGKRFRVEFRLDGRQAKTYGGSFKTKREALLRKAWVAGELAAMRVPDLSILRQPERAPTLAEAVERWKSSRVDVSDGTRVFHRVALDRLLPLLGDRRVDEISEEDLNEAVLALSEKGRKPATIRKSIQTLAIVLDDAKIDPNPARARVRFPYEEKIEPEPPTSAHVEAVFRVLPRVHRLPLLWLDWSGARLKSIEHLRVGDYDEPARRVRLRRATQKQRRALWVELPDVLAEPIEAHALSARGSRSGRATLPRDGSGQPQDRDRARLSRDGNPALLAPRSPASED